MFRKKPPAIVPPSEIDYLTPREVGGIQRARAASERIIATLRTDTLERIYEAASTRRWREVAAGRFGGATVDVVEKPRG